MVFCDIKTLCGSLPLSKVQTLSESEKHSNFTFAPISVIVRRGITWVYTNVYKHFINISQASWLHVLIDVHSYKI